MPGDSRPPRLAIAALDNPSCPDEVRTHLLSEVDDGLLALLGWAQAGGPLPRAVVDELRSRCEHVPAMVPELLDAPTAAQRVLSFTPLNDEVFRAALELLPKAPDRSGREGESIDLRLSRIEAAHSAWNTMWHRTLASQPERHREILDWATGTAAEQRVRNALLSDLPWDVEPELLTELAEYDLQRLPAVLLSARAARMRLDGSTTDEVRERLAAEISEHGEKRLHLLDLALEDDQFYVRMVLDEPVNWVEQRVTKNWKHILHPNEATDRFGRHRTWRTSAETLTELGRRFATAAVQVIPYWQEAYDRSSERPDSLRWLRETLTRFPGITPELRTSVRPIIRAAQAPFRADGQPWNRRPEPAPTDRLREDLSAIRELLAEPDEPSELEETPLGTPDRVSRQDLARLPTDELNRYLDSHPGDDALVEKALLSLAGATFNGRKIFSDVLERHAEPEAALLRLTWDLRRRLGGGPHLRHGWAELVLSLPDVRDEVVRALPLWSALRVRGGHYREGHPAVASVVREALGSNVTAWKRFAANPGANSGDNAWLRLGDVLDTAVVGTAWPTAPPKR